MNQKHQAPWECIYAQEEKSKCTPGKKPKSDQEYFEVLCLCILQAGLNWGMIRKNWEKYKAGFCSFNIKALAKVKSEELLKNPGIIKNIKKIESIIHNAKEFQKIKTDYGSFANFLKSQRERKDQEVIKLLTTRFKHLGNYSAEYFLHSVGFGY